MRRALAVVVILSLLGGQVGMLGALLGRYYAQQRMHHKVSAGPEALSDEATVQHLTIPQSERQSPNSSFVRIEDGEFRYQGNLYDVVHEEWRGDVWHVWVIHDQQEERYLNALAQAMERPTLKGSSVPVHQRPIALRPLALVPTALSSLPSPPVRWQPFPHSSFAAHQGPYLEVPHPPPWA
ncbi:MAG: hypothetical protein ABEL51_10335 [Salinibacter sp.]